jgi:HEAT repeat protein
MCVRTIAAVALLLASWSIWAPPAASQEQVGGKTIEEWIKDIGDTDPSVRQIGIRAVVNFGPASDKALDAVIKAANSIDASVRNDAAAALGMFQLSNADIPRVGAVLSSLLRDNHQHVRMKAASSLGTLGPLACNPKTTIPALTTMISDTGSWEVRKTAAYTLGRLGLDSQKGPDPNAMAALTGALRDQCAAVRLEAIMALSELGLSPRTQEVNNEKKALTYLQKDRDPAVRVWATVLLIFLDEKLATNDNINLLVNAQGDPDPQVRMQAIRALGALGRAGTDGKARLPNLLVTVPQVLAGLHAADDDTILMTLSILPPLGESAAPAMPQVAKLMKDKELAVRCNAIRTMGTLGFLAKPYISEIMTFLDDREEQVVISAIFALAQLGDIGQAALPILQKLSALVVKEPVASKDPARTAAIKKAAELAIKQIEMTRPKK